MIELKRSRYLQAALYAGMNGRGGLAAWQWLFIFDGIIGVPIGIYGYWAIPDQCVSFPIGYFLTIHLSNSAFL